MLKIAVWETLEGRRSPAQWARDVHENLVVRWLGQGIRPSRTALYDFRDRMGNVIQEIHATVIRQGMVEGLMDPQEAVQDGTFIRACASRHRTINMTVLNRRREELAAAIAQDETGESIPMAPRWMAKTIEGRREQSQRFAKAHEVLEQRLLKNSQRPKDKRLAESKVTVSTSDPEAPIARDKEKVFCPLYTTQFLVEPESRMILTFEVFAQATDAGTLAPMLDKTEQIIGHHLESVSADSAYSSLLDIEDCEKRGVELFAPVQENSFTDKKREARKKEQDRLTRDAFTWLPDEETYECPQGHRMHHNGKERKARRDGLYVIEQHYRCPPTHCRACPVHERCVSNPNKGRVVKRLEGQEKLDALRARMKTPEGQAKQKRRGQVIERSFADAKEHRRLRKLHGRGLRRARAEIGLTVFAQNVLTVLRLRKNLETADENST